MEAWSEERQRQPRDAREAWERVVVQERRGTRAGQRAWELRKVGKVLALSSVPCSRVLEPDLDHLERMTNLGRNALQLFPLGPRVQPVVGFQHNQLFLRDQCSHSDLPVVLPVVGGVAVTGDAVFILIHLLYVCQ